MSSDTKAMSLDSHDIKRWNRIFAHYMRLESVPDFSAQTGEGAAWRERLCVWFLTAEWSWKWRIVQGFSDGQHWVRVEQSEFNGMVYQTSARSACPITALLTALSTALAAIVQAAPAGRLFRPRLNPDGG